MTNAMEIYKFLPKTNCKECGKATCMAFAVSLLSRELTVGDCPPLKEDDFKANYEKLSGMLTPVKGAAETGMIVHEDKCFGCGNCVVACPVNVADDPHGTGIGRAPTSDKVILRVEDGIVRTSNVHECRRFGMDKILCNGCIVTCPTEAIEFV